MESVAVRLRERLWSAEHEARMARGLDHLPGAALRLARAELALAQAQINLAGYLRDHGVTSPDDDAETIPWAEFARLKLIEEKAAGVLRFGFYDSGGEQFLVHADAIAELHAALEGRRSDI